jgi:hypothetical protein
MKYRDPTIRSCRDVPKTVVIRRAPATPEPRVYRVPGPNLPHPPIKVHDPVVDRVLPGGLPPVAYRTPWSRVGLTGKRAREPFNSREVRGEHYATRKWLA